MQLPPIADAPDWLIRLATATTTAGNADGQPVVELDTAAALKRATKYLINDAPTAAQGERNITAFRVAAKVKDFGVSETENLLLIEEHWNGERCTPPLDYEEMQTTVESAYKTGFLAPGAASPDHDFADTPDQPEQEQKAPPTSIDEWLTRDLPEPDYLLGSWLHTTSRALLVAPTGVGKTNFSLGLAAAMAAGKDFLHWRAKRPCKVLYIDGEMSRRLMKQRLADACRRLDCQPEGLHLFSHEDAEDFPPLNTKEGRAYINGLINHIGDIDFIVFDNIMCLIAGDMREEESWSTVQPWIKTLTKRGIGQVWLHHTGHDETRSYGTKTREWQMDTVIHLDPVRRDGVDVSFNMVFRKARERMPDNRNEFADINVTLIDDRWSWRVVDRRGDGKASKAAVAFQGALSAALEEAEHRLDGYPAVTMDQWRDACIKMGLLDSGKPDSIRALFSKYRRELVTAGLIFVEGDVARLIYTSKSPTNEDWKIDTEKLEST